MIKIAVLPYGKSGVIGGSMLGPPGPGRDDGRRHRAVRRRRGHAQPDQQLQPSTIASNIAPKFPEATGLGVNTLIASGLVLFVITLGGQHDVC